MTDDRMRTTESLRLEGASGDRLVPPCCSQQAQLQQVAQGCSHVGFEYLQAWRLCNLSGQPVLLPDDPHHKKKSLFLCIMESPVLYFMSIASCPLTGQTRADHHQVFIHTDGLCWTHFSASMPILYWGAQKQAQHSRCDND